MSRATDSPRDGGLGRFLEGWWNDYARSLRRRRRTERTIGAYRRSFEDFWRFQLEYSCVQVATDGLQKLAAILNDLGAEGWELVQQKLDKHDVLSCIRFQLMGDSRPRPLPPPRAAVRPERHLRDGRPGQ